jgi:hypothetical protein
MYNLNVFNNTEALREAVEENALDMVSTLIHTEAGLDSHEISMIAYDTKEHIQEWLSGRDVSQIPMIEIQSFVWHSAQTLKGR